MYFFVLIAFLLNLLFEVGPFFIFHLHTLNILDSLSRTIHHESKSPHLELPLVSTWFAFELSVSTCWVCSFCTFAEATPVSQDHADHFFKKDPVRSSDDPLANFRILTLLHVCYRYTVLYPADPSFFVSINFRYIHVHLETFEKKDLSSTQCHRKQLARAVPFLQYCYFSSCIDFLFLSHLFKLFRFYFTITSNPEKVIKLKNNQKCGTKSKKINSKQRKIIIDKSLFLLSLGHHLELLPIKSRDLIFLRHWNQPRSRNGLFYLQYFSIQFCCSW